MADSDNQPVRRVVPEEKPEETIVEETPEETENNSSGGTGPTRITVGSRVSSWFTSAGHTISNGVGKLAGTIGIPKTAMSVILAVCVVGGGAGAATIINTNNAQDIILRQVDYEDDCADEYNEAVNKAPVSDNTDVSAQQQENAEKLWTFGKAMGMTDEQCAGMLGCLTQESGLDPTEIESIYGESFQIGEKKSALLPLPSTAMDSYVPGEMLNSYLRSGYTRSEIHLDEYKYTGEDKNIDSKYDNHYYCGLGLVQWTGPTAARLLDNAEKLKNNGVKNSEGDLIEWYDMDYQVAHMITSEVNSDGKSRFQLFLDDKSHSGSVESATESWNGIMERGEGHASTNGKDLSKKKEYAKQWYAKLSSQSAAITKKWESWANSVIALSDSITGEATGKHAAELDENCDSDEKQENYDNSTMARAAVAYAWKTMEMGRANNGTALYRAVHQAVFKDDNIYQSCDRSVATAVVWSNADDEFPKGNTFEQDYYMSQHTELWECLGELDQMDKSELEPGDILITTTARRVSIKGNGHVVMYVGSEIIQEKYPDDPDSYQCVSGSISRDPNRSRSPGCGQSPTDSFFQGDGYWVYRYVGNYDGQAGDAYTGNASGTSS